MSATLGWCVVWRKGTPESFEWNRSDEMSRAAADWSCQAFARDGVRAMVVNYRQSVAIGMPDTFSFGGPTSFLKIDRRLLSEDSTANTR